MKKYIIIFTLLAGITACNSSTTATTPAEGKIYQLTHMRMDSEIVLPKFNDKTTVEITENWATISYEDGNKIVINRDKIWSISVK